jgi:uncharacterized membrane protein
MQRSIYLAKLIGPVFAAIGIGMLLNTKVYLAMAEQAVGNHALIYISGLITLTAGIALVLAHNVWTGDWRLIITILGWLAVVGGTLRIVWPQMATQVGTNILSYPEVPMVAGFAVLVLGGVLSYYGYAEQAARPARPRRGARRRRAA